MTSFNRLFLASVVALLLMAIPVIVGAEGNEMHRIYFAEEGNARNGGVADYGMIQLTELEIIAGRQYLDTETIQFLEANLCLPEPMAEYQAVGEVAHTAFCQGEGMVDTANRVVLLDSVDSIKLYCSQAVRYAPKESVAPPPIVDGRFGQTFLP